MRIFTPMKIIISLLGGAAAVTAINLRPERIPAGILAIPPFGRFALAVTVTCLIQILLMKLK